MPESLSLTYVHEIAGEDYEFVKRFMTIFKEEFSWEVGMYLRHIKRKEPREASEIVAQSKYKLSMLGLKKSYMFAIAYEKNLRDGDFSKYAEFTKILEKVNAFLSKV
jgi:hypothetical protein